MIGVTNISFDYCCCSCSTGFIMSSFGAPKSPPARKGMVSVSGIACSLSFESKGWLLSSANTSWPNILTTSSWWHLVKLSDLRMAISSQICREPDDWSVRRAFCYVIFNVSDSEACTKRSGSWMRSWWDFIAWRSKWSLPLFVKREFCCWMLRAFSFSTATICLIR